MWTVQTWLPAQGYWAVLFYNRMSHMQAIKAQTYMEYVCGMASRVVKVEG